MSQWFLRVRIHGETMAYDWRRHYETLVCFVLTFWTKIFSFSTIKGIYFWIWGPDLNLVKKGISIA